MFHCAKNDYLEHTTSVLWFNSSLNCTGPFYQTNYETRSGRCRTDDNNYYYSDPLAESGGDGTRMICTTDFKPWTQESDSAIYL
jgi:hypothetical protein